VESELFGIEKGVATGVEGRAGKFEEANSGTLFLDEIRDLNLASQAKIQGLWF
jgi:transcriptional regulator with PAS, ATPase and Fis domain